MIAANRLPDELPAVHAELPHPPAQTCGWEVLAVRLTGAHTYTVVGKRGACVQRCEKLAFHDVEALDLAVRWIR